MSKIKHQLNPKKYRIPSPKSIIEEVNQSSDSALMLWLGDCINHADGAVILVKGFEASMKAHSLLCEHGLITPKKNGGVKL